ncbi:MAG: carboxypeptidase-like regulatory domain-containing protein [bacterium]
MKSNNLIQSIFNKKILILIAFVLFASCADDNPVKPDGGAVWKIGEKKEYNVSGGEKVEIEDEVSGLTFIFPDGGEGKLTIAKITTSPEMCLPSEQFYMEYSGQQDVEVLLPHNDNEYNMLYSYRAVEHEIEINKKSTDWWPVSEYTIEDNKKVFTVNAGKHIQSKNKIQVNRPPASNYFAIVNLPENSPNRTILDSIRKNLTQVIDLWLQYLPEDVAQTARNNIKSTLSYTISLSGSCAYNGNNSILWSNANFYFRNNVELNVIAHEVGHYMTHVLLGFNRYDELQTLFRTGRDHEPGLYGTRNDGLLEDYAYFSEYLVTGYFNGYPNGYDLSNVRAINNMCDIIGSEPSANDFPSYESFPTALWVALIRSANEIHNFESKQGARTKSKVPVINATVNNIMNLILRGPRTVDEARTHIQDYLDELGNEHKFKLPAMLEPIGWSYNGRGKVVDSKGNPLEGAVVHNISQTGEDEYGYRLIQSFKTGKDGEFKIYRLFPGESILRVFYNDYKDSMDFPLSIDWNEPTNNEIKIEDLVIDTDKYIQNYSSNWETQIYNKGVNANLAFLMNSTNGFKITQDVNPFGELRMIRFTMQEIPEGVTHSYNLSLDISSLSFNRSVMNPEPRWQPQIDSIWVDITDANGKNPRKVIYGPSASMNPTWTFSIKNKSKMNFVSAQVSIFLGMVDKESDPPQSGYIGSGIILTMEGSWP